MLRPSSRINFHSWSVRSWSVGLVLAFAGLTAAATARAQPGGPEGGSRPVLVPYWKQSAVGFPEDEGFNAERNRATADWIVKLYRTAELDARNRGRPVIPPIVPVVESGLVVYANDRGVVARAVVAGAAFGERYKAGELAWHSDSDGGLHWQAHELGGRTAVTSWLKHESYAELGDAVLHRTHCHTVVVRGTVVHSVDDPGLLPPPRKSDEVRVPRMQMNSECRTVVRDLDLAFGKLLQFFGSKDFRSRKAINYFVLGAPLTDRDLRVYLREHDGAVRLVKVDFPKYWAGHMQGGPDRGLDAGRKWEVDLATAPVELGNDPFRRVHALHLVEAGGLIVAPTNLGRVVAVDAVTGGRRWTHEYAPLDAKRFPTFAPEWVVVPPVVVRDQYVYAPADFPELLCLNVHTGKKIWAARKGDGLYPNIVGEQVLIVGEKTIRSLKLHDGSEQWKADLPGLPCGRGAVLGETYLVPVSEPKTWRGMIAVVDLKAGKVIEVLKSDAEQPIGNLVVDQDFLISQTLTEIAVFPIKK